MAAVTAAKSTIPDLTVAWLGPRRPALDPDVA
jgi:hypothetical protein